MFPINGENLANFHIKSSHFKLYSVSMYVLGEMGRFIVLIGSGRNALHLRLTKQFVEPTKNS